MSEEAARLRKSIAMADVISATCDLADIRTALENDAEKLIAMPDEWWRAVAYKAEVNPPHSRETKEVVAELLSKRLALFDNPELRGCTEAAERQDA